MTQIFISHNHENVDCAEQVRQDLQARQYVVWKYQQSIAPGTSSYVRAIESGIRGSAAMIVIWSAQAAASEWVMNEMLYSQKLKKPIYPIKIDATELPINILSVQHVECARPCMDAVAQILSFLPSLDSPSPIVAALEQLIHDHIARRREGVKALAELAEDSTYREEALALLEDVAHNDLYDTIRTAAQTALDSYMQRHFPRRLPFTQQPDYVVGARCYHCSNVSYFDKRVICGSAGKVLRRITFRGDGAEMNEISEKCKHCGKPLSFRVDCKGY